MMKKILAIAMLLGCNAVFAQSRNEEIAVKKAINLLFDGMRKSDSTMIRNAFNTGAILQTITKTKDAKTVVRQENLDLFIQSISKPHPEIYDERIVFTKILIDANLASVWTDYKFYIGENHQNLTSKNNEKDFDSSISNKKQTEIQWKFSHCGVNSFQLVKIDDTWKIVYLIDTRRKDNCN